MITCSNCGAVVMEGATNCPKCGNVMPTQMNNFQQAQPQPQYQPQMQPQFQMQPQPQYQPQMQPNMQYNAYQANQNTDSMTTAIKVLMIVGCVVGGFCYLIPLAWMIPMTVSYFNKVKRGEPISTAFKVCTLIFVSLIAGILMFCQGDPQNTGYVPPVNNGMNPNGPYTVNNNYYVQQPAAGTAPVQQPANNNVYGGTNPNLQ